MFAERGLKKICSEKKLPILFVQVNGLLSLIQFLYSKWILSMQKREVINWLKSSDLSTVPKIVPCIKNHKEQYFLLHVLYCDLAHSNNKKLYNLPLLHLLSFLPLEASCQKLHMNSWRFLISKFISENVTKKAPRWERPEMKTCVLSEFFFWKCINPTMTIHD